MYVAVVTTAIVFPLGAYLGTLAERERAARRGQRPAHEVLADLDALPTPEAILAELRGPLPGRRA